MVGAVAQLGERMTGSHEVEGSIPFSSTIFFFKGTFSLQFYVYVLKSESTGTSYVGHSKDLDKRIAEHNHGKSKSTRGKGPWRIIYKEEYKSRSEAMIREKYLKSVQGRLELKSNGIL